MYTISSRFGDARSRQSKLQKHRQGEPGTGRRRSDPSIHATSRPWHTSTPGIKMNVSTLGQIAARDPVAAKYLNRMNLSEMAQKKRGLAEREQGRGYDNMGMAMKRGLQSSVSGRKAMGAPNQDRIDQWQAELSDRVKDSPDRPADLPAPAGGGPAPGAAARLVEQTHWDKYVGSVRGLKSKLPKRPYHVGGMNIHRYQY